MCLHWRFGLPRAVLSRAALSLATVYPTPTRQEAGEKERLGVFYVLSEMLCGFLDTEASTRTGAERRYVGGYSIWIHGSATRNETRKFLRKLASFVLARRTAQISKKGG